MPWKRSNRTAIVHIVVTGYQKMKNPNKHYVFVIDVTWNNSERFEVYRRYSEFFSFQTVLKALFPVAAGKVINTERIIPQLPKRIFVGRSNVAKVAEARLDQLNRYTQTLFSLETYISESAHVVGFFSPRSMDRALPKLQLHQPPSLYPSKIPLGNMFEEYCALAEYVAEDSSQISFNTGDKVLVMSKDESGWWMCGVNSEVGWAPPSYIKKCSKILTDGESGESEEECADDMKTKDSGDSCAEDSITSDVSYSVTSDAGFFVPEIEAEEYKAIDSYQADGPGQISFEEGDMIHVLDKLEDGWWFVCNGKEEGWAPCSYLDGDKEESMTDISNKEGTEKYYAVDNYEAEEEDEISFPRGVVVDVLQKSLDGWWLINVDKRVGLAPATFLKKVESPDKNSSLDVTQSLPVIQTFQQPPRKQSVRAKASMRVKPLVGKTSVGKQISSLPPFPDSRPTSLILDHPTSSTPENRPTPPIPYSRRTPPASSNLPTPPILDNLAALPIYDSPTSILDNRPIPPIPDSHPNLSIYDIPTSIPDNHPNVPIYDRPSSIPDNRPTPPIPYNRPTPPIPPNRQTPPVSSNLPNPPIYDRPTSIPDNQPTPPIPPNRPTPPNRQTPPVSSNLPNPPIYDRPTSIPDNQPTPPIPDNQPTPPIPDNQPTPPIPDNQPTPPIPDNRPTPPIPDNQPTYPKPASRKSSNPKSLAEPVSSDLPDSDPENNYLNVSFDYMIDKPKRAASVSGSMSSSMSESDSLRGGTAKRPVATPRSKSPQMTMKEGKIVTTRSLFKEDLPTPSLTPKPKELPIVPSRNGLPLKENNSEGLANEPARPKMRPSSSEIKRAQDRARAATYNPSQRKDSLPSLKITEGSLPSLKITEAAKKGRGKQKVKKSISNDLREEGGKKLTPIQPSRQRHRSEGSPAKEPTSSKAMVPKEADEAGLDTQIAGTLLRYIISSEDSSLKEALRDLITKDSSAVCSINKQ